MALQVNAANLFAVIHPDETRYVDQVIISSATAAGYNMQYLPHRMLIPPGYLFFSNNGALFQAVMCNTLKDALLVL